MGKVIEFGIWLKIAEVRAEIGGRQIENAARLEELRRRFPWLLAGVALEVIDPSEALAARQEINRLRDEDIAIALILEGLRDWERQPEYCPDCGGPVMPNRLCPPLRKWRGD